MDIRKYFAASLAVCAAFVCTPAFSPLAFAADDTAAQTSAAASAEDATPVNLPYTYKSSQYGYTISCPQKPVGVIPVSALSPGEKGEVLIFANDGYNIKQAWVILPEAFTDAEIPANLGDLSEDQQKAYLKDLMDKSGYEFARLADINGVMGVYAVTAKVVDIDTDGDGKPDTTATADTQMVKTFFRGAKGGHYAVELIDNPALTKEGVREYQAGIRTFQEQQAAAGADSASNQKDKKDKHHKK